LCDAVKTTEHCRIRPFAKVGFRPILLKNSISIIDEKFPGVTGRDARVWLGRYMELPMMQPKGP
jgi:hypothetical protein